MQYFLRSDSTISEMVFFSEKEMASRIGELELALKEQRLINRELLCSKRDLESFNLAVYHDLCAQLQDILEIDCFNRQGALSSVNISSIQKAAGRMERQLNSLFDYAYCVSVILQYEQVDLAKLAKKVVNRLGCLHPDKKVQFNLPGRLSVEGDFKLLLVMMEHLIGNAWKYTNDCELAFIDFDYDAEKGSYFVRDNGGGFDAVEAEELFNPLQRFPARARFEGHGNSLAIVKRIVERHGGRIWCDSRRNFGTTVNFTLG